MVTRSKDTEQSYLARGWGHIKRLYGKNVREEDIDPILVAGNLISIKPRWTRSTWRQNKASMIFFLDNLALSVPKLAEQCRIAISMLASEPEDGCKRPDGATSSIRNKDINQKDFEALLESIRKSRSNYSGVLETWLTLGRISGLRPHEWCQAEICDEIIDDDGNVVSAEDEKGPFLRVVNSKNSNGRAHGKYRHLSMAGIDENTIKLISEFIGFMHSVFRDGQYETVYRSCASALLSHNKKLFKNKKKFIQLYSPRHMYHALLKRHYDKIAAAAAMGHSSVETGECHYGKRFSPGGSGLMTPVKHEIKRVAAINESRAVVVVAPSLTTVCYNRNK